MVEPTVVLCQCGDADLRVPIWPERGDYDVPGARVTHPTPGDRWVVTVQAPAGPVAGGGRPRPRPARRGPRQQPLEARDRLAVHPADDAAGRVVAVPGLRPALGRRRPVHRPVRARGLQARRPAARPLAAHALGRHRAGAARGDLRRAVRAAALPLAELVGGRLLRGRALQLLQRQAALGRPRVPPLPVPGDVELPDRRPGVRRALLRDRLRVLGGRRRPAGQHRHARRHRRPLPPEHALPLLGPGPGIRGRGHAPSTATGPSGRASTTSA